MRKISSYLYPNRIELLADLATGTPPPTEYTNVYQRNVKLYSGIDNTIEFDIKNADQKRIDLTTFDTDTIYLNVMDASGNELSNSPYLVTPKEDLIAAAPTATVLPTSGKGTTTTISIPTSSITNSFKENEAITGTGIVGAVKITGVKTDIDTATTTLTVTFQEQTVTGATVAVSSKSAPLKGIAEVTIPKEDLDLDPQFLKYSVSCKKGGNDVLLYADSRFGAVGTIELVGDAMPTQRAPRVYKSFTGEIDLNGNVVNHSSAIPATFYETNPTEALSFTLKLNNFSGTIWLQGTTNNTISVDSFKYAQPADIAEPWVASSSVTDELELFSNIPVSDYKYFRVCYQSLLTGSGASFDITRNGNTYSATLVQGGSKYAVGSVIRIPGSNLDGADGTNDLLITVTAVDTSQVDHITQAVSGFTVSGVAIGGTGTYLNRTGTIFTGKVVSVTVS